MKVLFATVLLLAGCATRESVDLTEVPEEITTVEEAIIVPEGTRMCPDDYVKVCKQHYVSDEDCRCIRRLVFDRGIPVRR